MFRQGKGCVVSEIDSSGLTIPGQRDDNRRLTRELSCLAIHSPLHPSVFQSRLERKKQPESLNHRRDDKLVFGVICPICVYMEKD